MKVFNDLKTRGVGDILIAVTDGLKGRSHDWYSTRFHLLPPLFVQASQASRLFVLRHIALTEP